MKKHFSAQRTSGLLSAHPYGISADFPRVPNLLIADWTHPRMRKGREGPIVCLFQEALADCFQRRGNGTIRAIRTAPLKTLDVWGRCNPGRRSQTHSALGYYLVTLAGFGGSSVSTTGPRQPCSRSRSAPQP